MTHRLLRPKALATVRSKQKAAGSESDPAAFREPPAVTCSLLPQTEPDSEGSRYRDGDPTAGSWLEADLADGLNRSFVEAVAEASHHVNIPDRAIGREHHAEIDETLDVVLERIGRVGGVRQILDDGLRVDVARIVRRHDFREGVDRARLP